MAFCITQSYDPPLQKVADSTDLSKGGLPAGGVPAVAMTICVFLTKIALIFCGAKN